MMVEFYKHGGRTPDNFDIYLHDDGRMSFDHRRPTKGYVRVIVELNNLRPNSHQAAPAIRVFPYFRDHVMVTPSGIFSQRYLRWATEVIGIDRVMFAADYPYAVAEGGASRRFIEETDLSEQDRSKIAFGNWERLCAQIRR